MGDVLSVAQARAAGLGKAYAVDTAGDAALDERITSAEAWLARRIGSLLGPVRIERLNWTGDVRVWLKRPVQDGTLTVTLDGDAVSDELFETHRLELVRVDELGWWGRLVISYTPDDEDVVREAIIKLLRLSLTETGMQSETISGASYSYTRSDGATQRQAREEVLAELLPAGAGIGY